MPHPCTVGRGVAIGALWGCHEGTGVALGCDKSRACWDTPGCPGGIIIDCWDKGTSVNVLGPWPCWLHVKLLGYWRGGGAGVPHPMGRVHTGKLTRGRGSFSEDGGRIGDRNLSMITMLARMRISNLMLGKLQRKRVKGERRHDRRKERKREEKKGKEKEKEKEERKKERGGEDRDETRGRTNRTRITFTTHLTSRIWVCNTQLLSINSHMQTLEQIFWKTTRPRYIK